MVSEKILCNRSDALEIIAEARDEWLIDVLVALGVEEDIIEQGFSDSPSDREDYIYAMNDLGIMINLHSSGEVDIYKMVWLDQGEGGWLPIDKKQLVAQWKAPTRTLRIDGLDAYYEIEPNQWSIKTARI